MMLKFNLIVIICSGPKRPQNNGIQYVNATMKIQEYSQDWPLVRNMYICLSELIIYTGWLQVTETPGQIVPHLPNVNTRSA